MFIYAGSSNRRGVIAALVVASCVVTVVSRPARAQENAVLALAFSEGTGSVAADFSGAGHAGTLSNDATWTPDGRFGSGLVLDGRRSGVRMPLVEAFALTSAFTLEAWVKPAADNGARYIVQMPGAAGEGLLLNGNDRPRFAATFTSGPAAVVGPEPLPADVWTHLAVTYDGGRVRLYVDAREVATEEAPGALEYSVPETVWVGRSRTGRSFSGTLDEARIYRRALTPAELLLDMATPVDPSSPFQVTRLTPAPGAFGVLHAPVTATFSASVAPATVTANTVVVSVEGEGAVSAMTTYDAASFTVVVTPAPAWDPLSTYTVRILGGPGGVTDLAGRSLEEDHAWSFTTGAPDSVPSVAYAFSEGGGTVAHDGSGNGHVGVLAGSAEWTDEGVFGGAATFHGADAGVQVPASDALSLSGAFTIESWVRPYGRNGDRQIVQIPGALNGGLRLTANGRPRFVASFAGGRVGVTGPAPLPLDAWTHVAVTYDGSHVRLYVGGIEVRARHVSGSLEASEPRSIWIGRSRTGDVFSGAIDEVRIYRRALTASEIALDMTGPVDGGSIPLAVTERSPDGDARGVLEPKVRVTFNKPLAAASVTTSSVTLMDLRTGLPVSSAVGLDMSGRVLTLAPHGALRPGQTYRMVVAGGIDGVRGVRGDRLASTESWSFTLAQGDDVAAAAYGFGEGAGTVTADLSGNGNVATLVDGPVWTAAGKFGHALAFEGGDASVVLPVTGTLTLDGAFTLEAWVKPDASNGVRHILQLPGANGEGLRLNGNSRPRFSARFASGAAVVVGASRLAADVWTHVAVVYEEGEVRLYVNGVGVAAAPASGGLADAGSGAVRLGRANRGNGFTGVLDEVRIYRRALTHVEIATDMHLEIVEGAPEPTIAVNGVLPPDPMHQSAGATVAVRVNGGPGNPADWVSLAPAGAADEVYVARQYLNGSETPPAHGMAEATLTFLLPAAGDFEFRLYEGDTFNRLAASTVVIVEGIDRPSEGPCVYAVSPASIAAEPIGASGTLHVSTRWGCERSPSADAPWVTVTPVGYAARVLEDAPVGYWRLDGVAGEDVADLSGNGLSGMEVGTLLWGGADAVDRRECRSDLRRGIRRD